MAQRVEGEALASQPGAFEERPVLPIVEVVVVGRPANTVGKDEAGVAPRGGLQPLFVLAHPVSPQGGHGGFVEGHGAAVSLILRSAEGESGGRDLQRAGSGFSLVLYNTK